MPLSSPCTLVEKGTGTKEAQHWFPHRVLLVLLSVLGGELLPAATLQPCAGALSGRGHIDLRWTGQLGPGYQHLCSPCRTGMRQPLGMAPCARGPSYTCPVGGSYPLRAFASTFLAHFRPHMSLCVFYCAPKH